MIKVTDEMLDLIAIYDRFNGDMNRETLVKRIIEMHEDSNPKQEPIGYAWIVGNQIQKLSYTKINSSCFPLYTAPQIQTPLSIETVKKLIADSRDESGILNLHQLVRLVEQAHGIGTK